MKTYETVEAVVKAFINDNKEVVELLTCSVEDMSYEDLCAKESILYEIKLDGVVEGDLPCSFIVTCDGEYVNFDVLCKHSAWALEGIVQRPLEILSRVRSYLGNDTVVGDNRLEFIGTSGNPLNEQAAIYSLNYMYEDCSEFYDLNVLDYVSNYKAFWGVLSDIITSDKELLSLLGENLQDATMDQLIKQGYVRFASDFNNNPETDYRRGMIVEVEGLEDVLLTVNTICDSNAVDMEDGVNRLETIANRLERDLQGIHGAKFLRKEEHELSETLKMYTVVFSVRLTEETLTGVLDEKESMYKYKVMRRPNFFCDMATMNVFSQKIISDNYDSIDFTVDIIDAPMMLVYTSDDTLSTMRVCVRNEIYSHDDESDSIATATLDHSTGKISVKEDNLVDEEGVTMLAKACSYMSQHSQENNLSELYEGLDAEKAGILVEQIDDGFTHKVVSGRERPDLLCNNLFGECHMCRPYTDENSDNWMHELAAMNMSIEEKIENAEAGDVYWMRELTNAYRMGDGVEESPEQAFYWMEKLAETGDATAQYNVAVLYSHGNGTERNIAKALEWMQKAAENGDIDAVNSLESFEKAAVAEKNAATGDEQAQVDLANYLMSNRSESNLKECYELCVSLSDKGNVEGHYLLGLCYEHGRGCQEDIQKAAEAYKKGADLGDQYCQFNYACLVLNGSVNASKNDAAELVKKSAEQGYDLAQSALSHMYESGQYEEYNLDKAIEWGEKAAQQGNANIQYQVAKLYTYDGKDGKMLNAERAKYWLEKAALQGHEMAYGMLNFGPMWEEDDCEDVDTKNEKTEPISTDPEPGLQADEPITTRSNMFADFENKFKNATKEALEEIAISSATTIIEAFSEGGDLGDQVIFVLLTLGAKLGIVGDGVISDAERALVDRVFTVVGDGDLESIYDVIGKEIEEEDYEFLGGFMDVINHVSIPFLSYILSFAYIDKVFEDEVANRLDSLFGMNLLINFMDGEDDNVPANNIQINGLEAEIVEWFQSDDQLRPLKEIVEHFQNTSEDEVKRVLDELCNKGILYGGDNIVGCMYGLVSADVAFTNVTSDDSANKDAQSRGMEKKKYTYDKGIKLGGSNYSIVIPDGFSYKKHVLDDMSGLKRDFVAWNSGDSWETSEIAFMPAVPRKDKPDDPNKWFEMVGTQLQAFAEQIGCRVETKSFKNDKIYGGYCVQEIDDECTNYHCIVGTYQNAHQFRVIFNGGYSREYMDAMVEEWLNTMECTSTVKKEQPSDKTQQVKKAKAGEKGQHKVNSATETICVNDDFNITFSKGMFYIILEESIEEYQKIIKFGRLNEDKQDLGDQVRIDVDDDADFFGSLVKREFEPGQYQKYIEKFEFKEVMRRFSLDESNEREKQINAYVTEIRTKEGFKSKYKVYKDEDNLKIGYYTTLLGDDMLIPTYMIQIITPKALYVGNFTFTADVLAPGLREMLGDSEADDEKFLDGIFNSITLPSEIDVDNSGLNKIHLDDKKASKSKSTSSKNERLSEKEVLNQMSDIHAEVKSQLREIDWQWRDEKRELQKLLSDKTYSFDFELQMDADVVGKVIDACGEVYTSLLDAYDDKVERLWEKLETSNARMKYAEECFEMAKAIYAKMDELRYEFKQPGVLGESLGSVSYDRPSSRVRNKWEKRVEDERKKAENSPEYKQKLDSDMEKWKEEVEKIKENREKAMAERSEQIDLHTKGKKEDTITAKDKERESIMQMQQRNRDNLRTHRLELESMGKIHFVKRSSLEKLIQQEEIKDKEYDKDLQYNRCKLNEELKELDVKAEKEKKAAVEDIEKKYPIPRSPEVIKKIEEKRRKMFSGENGEIKLEILRAMLKYNRPGTSQQIQKLSYKLSNYPEYKISAMITQLTDDGFVGRMVEKKYAFYYINDEVAAKEMVES